MKKIRKILCAAFAVIMTFACVSCAVVNPPDEMPPNGEPPMGDVSDDGSAGGDQGEGGGEHETQPEDYENYFPKLDIITRSPKITSKETYVDAKITLTNTKEEYAFESVNAGIRLRGNSTMGFAKKPYRIKFNKKQSVLGEPAHKSWVLLADYLDASLMKNYSAFYFASKLDGLEFTPSAHHVELWLNGTYKGVYLLCDQVQEQKNTRVPVEVDVLGEREVPFLIEKNYRAESETEIPYDWFTCNEHTYTIKYPENLTKTQYDYISDYYSAIENAVKNKDFDYVRANVDLDSLYDFYIVNDMFFNRDALFASCYMYKTQSGKLTFGPVWDFDWTLDAPWTGKPTVHNDLSSANKPYFTEFDPSYNEPGWWCWLMDLLEDETCRSEFSARWEKARAAALNTVEHLADYKKKLEPAAKRNSELWYKNYEAGGSENYTPVNGSLFDDQYKFLSDFLSLRIEWFDLTF